MRWLMVGLSVCALSSTEAAIRVYNPDTGQSEAIKSTPTQRIVPAVRTAPKARPATILPPEDNSLILLSDIPEAEKTDARFGHITVFVDMAKMDGTTLKNIQKIAAFKGVETRFYTQHMTSKEMVILSKKWNISERDMTAAEDNTPDILPDRENAAYTFWRPGGWHKIVYKDALGSKRVYELKQGVDRLGRHLKRVQKAVLNGQ